MSRLSRGLLRPSAVFRRLTIRNITYLFALNLSMGEDLKFIDIGSNLTDPMFSGIYNGSKKHEGDLNNVLKRAWKIGLKKIIITGGNLQDSKTALQISRTDERLFCTVGCHPTRCNEFEESGDADKYLESLIMLASDNKDKVVAVGECGLDFDRLQFCPKDTQLRFFELQLQMSEILRLPLFLHCRNAATDMIPILHKFRDRLCGGVVHSYDGSIEDANALLDMGYYIGINGCSLKTEENLEVVAHIPTDRLMIETDAPWCEVRKSFAGFKHIISQFSTSKKEKWSPNLMVQGRCEPARIIQVLEIMAAVRDEDIKTLSEVLYENTERVFFPPNGPRN